MQKINVFFFNLETAKLQISMFYGFVFFLTKFNIFYRLKKIITNGHFLNKKTNNNDKKHKNNKITNKHYKHYKHVKTHYNYKKNKKSTTMPGGQCPEGYLNTPNQECYRYRR